MPWKVCHATALEPEAHHVKGFLEHKGIPSLLENQRFEMDHYTETLLRSLKRNGVEYSDVLIKGPETLAVGRLVLDPYSATLYSSSPRVFAGIEELVKGGVPLPDAIERVAFPHHHAETTSDFLEVAE